jgi:tetratricopeptide (TPR) repeat protein
MKKKKISDKNHSEDIARNAPCPCASGKKYKNCCMSKMQNLQSSTDKLISMNFTTKPIPHTETGYDETSEEDREILEQIHHRVNFHPETIQSEKDEYFSSLNKFIEKYSNLPYLWNYLLLGYKALRKHDKVRELIFQTFRRFPNYLFARVAVFNVYLEEGKPEKFLEIFGEAKTLQELYPHRTRFHVTEGRAFHQVLAHYYCATKNVALAKNQLKILEMISKSMKLNNDLLIQQVRFEIIKLDDSDDGIKIAFMKSMMHLE